MARTIRTKIYKFEELSKAAKQKAIEWWKEGETFDWIYEEAWESLKAFCKVFSIDMDSYDFEEPYRSRYSFDLDDQILELSGQRLATYIWNNFRSDIYKGKFYNSWTTEKHVKHRKVKSQLISKETGWSNKELFGKYYNSYYGLTPEISCPFTGVCYDMDLLDPIIKFMDRPTSNDFKDLLEDCLSSLSKSVQSEIKASLEDENVADSIIANEYEFLKDGTKY